MEGSWQDSNTHVLTVGAMNNNTQKATEFIEGIINLVVLYSNPLSLSQIHDQATCKLIKLKFLDKCQPHCNMCQVSMIPKCI